MSHINHNQVNGLSKLSDPSYIGPGKWDTFMIECADARTVERQKEVIEFIKRQIDHFRCECKENAKSYMKDNPIEKMIGYKVNGEMVGLLLWMWGFHNFKNNQLNKKYSPTWKEVYDYYWLKKGYFNVPCISNNECKEDIKAVKEKIFYIEEN